MSVFTKKITDHKKTIIIAMLAIGIVGSIVAIAFFSSGDGLGPDDAAFGKLPAVNRLGASETSFALGVPARPGVQEMIVREEYEYRWVGGNYPDMPRVAKVYRRINKDWDIDRIKELARRLGFDDTPIDVEIRGAQSSIEESREKENMIAPAPGTDIRSGTSRSANELGIYRFSGDNNSSYLEVYGRDGRFFYENILGEVEDDELPIKKESIAIAKNFLKNVGLYNSGLTSPKASEGGVILETPATITSDGIERVPSKRSGPTFIEVGFSKTIDGNEIGLGMDGEGYRALSVMVGKGGKIISASGELPGETESSDYPLIDVKAAFKKIKEGVARAIIGKGMPEPAFREGPESLSSPIVETGSETSDGDSVDSQIAPSEIVTGSIKESDLQTSAVMPMIEPMPVENPDIDEPETKKTIVNIELESVELIYTIAFDDQGTLYYQPGYLFFGRVEGSEIERRVLVDAIDEKYLEK